MNRIRRVQLVRARGGWRNYRIQIYRGTAGKYRTYAYKWQYIAMILACLRWGAWVGAVSSLADTYDRVDIVVD